MIPSNHNTASFLYLLSPRELILIAGSFPLFPQRLIVNGETLRTSATSLTVRRSGKVSNDILLVILSLQLPIYSSIYHSDSESVNGRDSLLTLNACFLILNIWQTKGL